jgi:SSS family solute:Na+ symporter
MPKGSFLWIVNNIFFQYYSLLITIVCIIVFIGVSYATPKPDYAKSAGLLFLQCQNKIEGNPVNME